MSIRAVQNLVGYVRDDKRRTERVQRALMKQHGIERVYADWLLLMRQRRKGLGDVVAVTDLWVIADPSKRTVKSGMRKSLMQRRAELRSVGASILELTTGRHSLDVEQADAMLADALDVLANTRNRSRRIGRPAVQWTDAERIVIKMHWLSREHPNDQKALAAIKRDGIKSANYARVRAEFGPSGRIPGGNDKSRATQWAKRKKKLK